MSDEVTGGVVKVIEVVGSSPTSFDAAVRNTLQHASQTVRQIRGLEVLSQTVEVEGSEPVNYKVHCKIAFVVESGPARTQLGSTGQDVDVSTRDPQDEVGAAIRRSTVD